MDPGPRRGVGRERETIPRKLPILHNSLSVQVFDPRNVHTEDELVSLDTIQS